MANPIRNHLDPPGYGSKLGERMDATSRHLCNEIKRVLLDYSDGSIKYDDALRELDAVQALATHEGTILPAVRMDWESSAVDQWLPREGA